MLGLQLDRRAVAFAGGGLAGLAVAALLSRRLTATLSDAVAQLAAASPVWLWLAAAALAAMLASMGGAWRAGVRACGGDVGRVDAACRFAVGSLANSVLPAGAGAAIRIGLFSRRLPRGDRVWVAGGISAAIGAARAAVLALLVLAAAAVGAFPLWPLLLLLAAVAAAVAAALLARRRPARSHVAHFLDAFRALGRAPRSAAVLVAWAASAMAARVAAAACVAASVGVPEPLAAGVVAVVALVLSGIVQLTPANIGVGSGAVALALGTQGVELGTALSAGIALQALETTVGLTAGGAAVLSLARVPVPAWSIRLAGGGACVALAGAFGATVLA